MVNHYLITTPFERKRCDGHHPHASACNAELSTAAQFTPKMQSLFIEALQIAHNLPQTTRDPFQGFPSSSAVLATN
eukprot:1691767-Pyramimonas_sp.AAC.1